MSRYSVAIFLPTLPATAFLKQARFFFVFTVRLRPFSQLHVKYVVVNIRKQNVFEISVISSKTLLTQNVSGNSKQTLNRRLTCWCMIG